MTEVTNIKFNNPLTLWYLGMERLMRAAGAGKGLVGAAAVLSFFFIK